MNRKETTKFLSELLERDRLSGMGKYWANEVSIDPWNSRSMRVDYMQFVPPDQCYISSIEKGIFVCYEIKSCKEDVYSGNGLNFIGEKNYIVTTMECYKSLQEDLRTGKLTKYIMENYPESSMHFGIMVAIPAYMNVNDEYENPTPLNENKQWKLAVVNQCHIGHRKRSMTELMFCMIRSGRR